MKTAKYTNSVERIQDDIGATRRREGGDRGQGMCMWGGGGGGGGVET